MRVIIATGRAGREKGRATREVPPRARVGRVEDESDTCPRVVVQEPRRASSENDECRIPDVVVRVLDLILRLWRVSFQSLSSTLLSVFPPSFPVILRDERLSLRRRLLRGVHFAVRLGVSPSFHPLGGLVPPVFLGRELLRGHLAQPSGAARPRCTRGRQPPGSRESRSTTRASSARTPSPQTSPSPRTPPPPPPRKRAAPPSDRRPTRSRWHPPVFRRALDRSSSATRG